MPQDERKRRRSMSDTCPMPVAGNSPHGHGPARFGTGVVGQQQDEPVALAFDAAQLGRQPRGPGFDFE